MGAYENPNINIGVDTQSGKLIGQAIANVGQSIAKGQDAQTKAYRELSAKQQKIREENKKITIKANDKLLDNEVRVQQDTQGIKHVNDPATAVQDLNPLILPILKKRMKGELLTSQETQTYNNYNKGVNGGFKNDLQDGSALLSEVFTRLSTTKDADQSQTNPSLHQLSTGNVSSINNRYVNGQNQFYLMQEYGMQNGEVIKLNMSNLGTQNETSPNENYYKVGDMEAVFNPKLGEVMTNSFIEDKKLIKGKFGVDALGSQFQSWIKSAPVFKTYQGDGVYETAEQWVDTGSTYVEASTTADARAELELNKNNGFKTANAYLNLYDGYVKETKTVDGRRVSVNKLKPGDKEKLIIGYINIPKDYQNHRDSNTGEFGETQEIPIYQVQPDPKAGNSTELDNGMMVNSEALNNFKQLLTYENVEALGGFSQKIAKKDKSKGIKVRDLKGTEQGIGDLILKEIDGIKIKTEKDVQALSGLTDGEAVEKGNSYRQENIREHKKYLNEKGIKVKTRDEIIKGYKALEGTKATKTSSPYTKEDVNRFIEGLGKYELFDGNEEPFVSYDPYKNSSLIPILQASKGYTASQNEKLGEGNIRPRLSNYNIE